MFEFDLQLFAEPDEPTVEEEVVDESVEEEETVEEPEEEIAEEEEEAPPKKPDKVTAAIIREKQANKALRDKVAALEKERASREQENADKAYRQKLIDSGFTDDDVEERVASRRTQEELKRELKEIKYGQQVEKLAVKYPSINDHLSEFIKIVEDTKGAITLADLCKAKLDETSTQEIKTKAEQEVLLNKQKAKSKQVVAGEDKSTGTIKFSPADEAAFKFYAERNPGKTRKDYNEILKVRKG